MSQRTERQGWGRRLRGWFTPGRDWGMGAALALLVATIAIWLWGTLPKLNPQAPAASARIALLDVLVALVISGVVMFLVRRLVRLPGLFLWMAAFFGLMMFGLGTGPSPKGWYLTIALLGVALSLLGGLLWWLAHGGWRRAPGRRRGLALAGLLLSLGILAGGGIWLGWPGAPAPTEAAVAGTALAGVSDPSQPGPFSVGRLTYGSGTDRNRAEFGAEAALRTETVDGTALIGGWSSPSDRTTFWGFDARQLPLNGRVWYPEGEGPFPLLLMVHGNSRADAYSDGGFAYLGELLASRGYLVASLDENFLNTSLFDRSGGLTGTTAARGWLLLEHLRLWHEWNGTAGTPFTGKVDTDRIALLGHSRGGEAIAIDAAFNRMARYPDNEALTFNYGYAIRSLVALAPSEGFYLPAGQPIQLENLNYLALQGSYDADIGTFAALNSYDRLAFTDGQPWLKAAIYLHRANHGQFNSSWDRYDLGEGLATRFFNVAALLTPAEQQQITKVFVTAFLESTLKGEEGYRPLLHDPRTGHEWLPPSALIRQYAESGSQPIATFEEDTERATITLAGGSAEAEGLSTWEEGAPPRRRGTSVNHVVTLRSEGAPGAGRYTLVLPTGNLRLSDASILRLDAALLGPGAPEGGADFTIELGDAAGNRAALPLSHIATLHAPLVGQYLKVAALQGEPLSEPILQTFDFPLADFVAASAAFDPATLSSITLVVGEAGAAGLVLDNIVIARP